MSVIEKLASSLGRRDEVPNQELAMQIVEQNDESAVKELVENLGSKSKDIQSDCIKVLYEIGEREPVLISGFTKEFLALLTSKNNRLQWGAMTALSSVTEEIPETIYSSLDKIIAAADSGSVITKDNAVNILIKLCSVKKYSDNVFPLLIEQILNSPSNQLPMYAERSLSLINSKNKDVFIKALTSRLDTIEKDSKRKRVEKIIKQAGAKL